MNVEKMAAERLGALIDKGESVLRTHKPNPPGVIGFPTLDQGLFLEWRSQSLSYLKNLVGAGHTYVDEFEKKVDKAYQAPVKGGIGILKAAKEDVEGGFLTDVKALVSAEVFSDFLEMAAHLLESGYKDPAASLTGAVLEDGLRRLGSRHGVKVKTRDDLSTLNHKLADAGTYNRLMQKRIQVWNDIRNNADHAHFDEYSLEDVQEMHAGVEKLLAESV